MDLTEKIKKSIIKQISLGSESARPYELHIGYGTDAAYARPMGVSVTSLALNNPDVMLNIHVLASSIYDEDVARLKRMTEMHSNLRITLYMIDETIVSGMPVLERFPLAIYYRLLMPTLFAELPRILYLDSDIVCLGDLKEIVALDLEGNIIGACLDEVASESNNESVRKVEKLGMPNTIYFNSGVILIDIPAWNKNHVSQQIFDLLSQGKLTHLPDQDALNLTLRGKVFFLPVKWNYTRGNKGPLPTDTVLLHIGGQPKPWSIVCTHKAQPYYLHYEKNSPWAGLPLYPPDDYQQARSYSKQLFLQGNFLESLVWLLRHTKWKFETKILKRPKTRRRI